MKLINIIVLGAALTTSSCAPIMNQPSSRYVDNRYQSCASANYFNSNIRRCLDCLASSPDGLQSNIVLRNAIIDNMQYLSATNPQAYTTVWNSMSYQNQQIIQTRSSQAGNELLPPYAIRRTQVRPRFAPQRSAPIVYPAPQQNRYAPYYTQPYIARQPAASSVPPAPARTGMPVNVAPVAPLPAYEPPRGNPPSYAETVAAAPATPPPAYEPPRGNPPSYAETVTPPLPVPTSDRAALNEQIRRGKTLKHVEKKSKDEYVDLMGNENQVAES